MSAFENLLGAELLVGDATVATKDVVSGKNNVLLYFSAHWCGPCRMFTPMLIEFYKKHAESKNFEIVFVSSDRDDAAFKDYYGSMPWKALPFANRDLKAKLSAKFKVQGIPTLVCLDSNGKTITADARGKVMTDPAGAGFPWAPKPFWDLLGDASIHQHGSEGAVKASDVRARTEAIALYFSASWCGPCRAFTPQLKSTYEKLKGKFEIILVPADRDTKSWQSYWADMPWLSIEFGDDRAGELGEIFGVEGIPALVIIDSKTGKTITTEGRSAVSSDPEGKEFPWIPKPVAELGGAGLNENACLMLLFGSSEAKNDTVLNSFETVAKELIAHWQSQGEETQPVYFYQSAGGPLEERVRAVLGVEGTSPKLVLMNLPAAERFVHEGELSEAAFRDVATKYASGQLQTESLE